MKRDTQGMISRRQVHEAIFECELRELEDTIDNLQEKIKKESSKNAKKKMSEDLAALENEHENLKKASRFKEYKRKAEKLAERFPDGAFFIQEGKNVNDTLLTKEQAIVYAVLIGLASKHGSWVNVWCNSGIECYGSRGIVELYEYIKENIYMNAGITEWGAYPFIDQWLQVLDVELDYTMSKRVCIIIDKLELMRTEGLGINHQINYGSIICQDGADTYYARKPYGPVPSAVPKKVDPFDYEKFATIEQFFSGMEVLADRYLESIKYKSGDMLKWGIETGCVMCDILDMENDDEELPRDFDIMPEYQQRNKNLIKYLNYNSETVKEILKDKNITKEQAKEYLEKLPS